MNPRTAAVAAEAAPTVSWIPAAEKTTRVPRCNGAVGAASAATRALRRATTYLAAIALTMGAALATTPAPLPGDSVYHLDIGLTDQDAHDRRFPALRGEVRVVSMFYANCPYVCPLIVDTLKHTERALSDAERARLRITLVSLDPERDTPAALREVADKRHLDLARWTLARASAQDVRKLAAMLGVQYRHLENREFNQSSVLVLLDADGRVLARSSRLGESDPEFVAAVRKALAAGSPR